MKLILDENSYIEIKHDKIENQAKLSIKTREDKKSTIITAILSEEQIVKLITELVSVKAEMYGK